MAATSLRRCWSPSSSSSSSFKPLFNIAFVRHTSSVVKQSIHDRNNSRITWIKQLNATLQEIDHEIADIIGMKRPGSGSYIEMAERLCQKRALEAFQLDPTKWGGIAATQTLHDDFFQVVVSESRNMIEGRVHIDFSFG